MKVGGGREEKRREWRKRREKRRKGEKEEEKEERKRSEEKEEERRKRKKKTGPIYLSKEDCSPEINYLIIFHLSALSPPFDNNNNSLFLFIVSSFHILSLLSLCLYFSSVFRSNMPFVPPSLSQMDSDRPSIIIHAENHRRRRDILSGITRVDDGRKPAELAMTGQK